MTDFEKIAREIDHATITDDGFEYRLRDLPGEDRVMDLLIDEAARRVLALITSADRSKE